MLGYPVAIKSWKKTNYTNFENKCKLKCNGTVIWNEEEEDSFYAKYFDDEWFNFVKRYLLLLEKAVIAKKILLSILPFYIIHLVSQYSSPLLFPLFIMPTNCLLVIKAQKKKFILNNVIKKFELLICNRYQQHVKHKLSYYPNTGLFIASSMCCTDGDKIIYNCLKYKTEPIVRNTYSSEFKLLVHLEMKHNKDNIGILIKINEEIEFCYKIDSDIFKQASVVGLLNVNDYIPVVGEEYGYYTKIVTLNR